MKKNIITFVALIIGLICRAQTVDENYYFKSLSSQNGLSQNTVSAILQDSKGFMWFGTKDGLDRYDAQLGAVYILIIVSTPCISYYTSFCLFMKFFFDNLLIFNSKTSIMTIKTKKEWSNLCNMLKENLWLVQTSHEHK